MLEAGATAELRDEAALCGGISSQYLSISRKQDFFGIGLIGRNFERPDFPCYL